LAAGHRHRAHENQNGCGRTRTCEARRRQIYSLVRLPLRHTPAITPRTGVEPVPTPRQGVMTTVTPTRPHKTSGRAGESNPRHDIHSVGCCHYTMLTISETQAEEEGLEPSSLYGRPRLADACDKPIFASLPGEKREAKIEKREEDGTARKFSLLATHFSLLPSMSPPGIEPGFRASHARVVFRSTTGTSLPSRFSLLTSRFYSSLPSPGVEPGPRRSKRRMISISPRRRFVHFPGRTRTGNAELEAPSDRPFHHGDSGGSPQTKTPRKPAGGRSGLWGSVERLRFKLRLPATRPAIAPQRANAKAPRVAISMRQARRPAAG
jgi:hypothetical protein